MQHHGPGKHFFILLCTPPTIHGQDDLNLSHTSFESTEGQFCNCLNEASFLHQCECVSVNKKQNCLL